jgi:hypothetical protein
MRIMVVGDGAEGLVACHLVGSVTDVSELADQPDRGRPDVSAELAPMLRAALAERSEARTKAARHCSVSPSRCSEWSKDWETEESRPKRRMIGRCKVLAK